MKKIILLIWILMVTCSFAQKEKLLINEENYKVKIISDEQIDANLIISWRFMFWNYQMVLEDKKFYGADSINIVIKYESIHPVNCTFQIFLQSFHLSKFSYLEGYSIITDLKSAQLFDGFMKAFRSNKYRYDIAVDLEELLKSVDIIQVIKGKEAIMLYYSFYLRNEYPPYSRVNQVFYKKPGEKLQEIRIVKTVSPSFDFATKDERIIELAK